MLYEGDDKVSEKSFGRHGRPIRSETDMDRAVEGIVRAARRGLAISGVRAGSIEFGLKLDAEAGFVISRGTADASIVFKLNIEADGPATHQGI
ncbi:CU044_2847 family protein [Micromonospora sp. NPDC049891]|uniref:CU044_2847 family protein n=1 Tax=Micromonospora sp. NPDC049891 TaxID=3155655 RepID=UPI0033C68223